MARIARNLSWLIGRTPLLELGRYATETPARLLGKIEAFNPTGSNKDRAVLAMIEHAERSGFLTPETTIVECSAGDLGMSLAMICACRGYRLILTMPECTATSRCNLLRALGAEIVLTDAEAGIRGALDRAEELSREIDPSFVMQPFSNRANTQAHAENTAREIWEDTDGLVDIVVAPVGSGGTASGCLEFFRGRASVYAVEPETSAILSGGRAGAHDIPGIGAGFVPEILNASELAGALRVSEADAFESVRRLAASEGLLVGPAAGAVASAALELARDPAHAGKTIVAILPDHGERYEDHASFNCGEEPTS